MKEEVIGLDRVLVIRIRRFRLAHSDWIRIRKYDIIWLRSFGLCQRAFRSAVFRE